MKFENIFGSESKIKVLRVLANSSEGNSISQIAKKTKLSRTAVSNLINELLDSNLIQKRIYGRTHLIILNKDNYFSDVIIELFNWEKSTNKRLINTVRSYLMEEYAKEGVYSIVIFGSVSRGEQKISSDIDVMIIYDKSIEKDIEIQNFRGLVVSIFHINKKEFKKKYLSKDALIKNVAEDAKVIYKRENFKKLTKK